VTDAIEGTVVVEPGRPDLVGEVHPLLVLFLEGYTPEEFPVVASFLEQSFDFIGQLHLNIAAVSDPDPSPRAELPGEIVVEDNFLGYDTILPILDRWKKHLVHEYVHVQVFLVRLRTLRLRSLQLLGRQPIHRGSSQLFLRTFVKT
jgi:hypothetical protein